MKFLCNLFLNWSVTFISCRHHPRPTTKALAEALRIVNAISIPIDTSSDEQMLSLIKTSIGTKFSVRWSDLMCKLALEAVRTVAIEASPGPQR